MPSIFLSHSWKDKGFTRRLAEALREAGVSVWIDEAEFRVGDSLLEKIGDAIEKNDYVGLILSANSVRSRWVLQEAKLAMTKELRGKSVVVLPILIEDCAIPPFLYDKIYADFTGPESFQEAANRLLRAMNVDFHGPRSAPRIRSEPDQAALPPVRRIIRLTERELEVLHLVLEGKSSREAAHELFVSKRVVDFHLASIYEKLQVSNRVQALRRITALGLFDVPESD